MYGGTFLYSVILDTTCEAFAGAISLTDLFDDFLLASQESGCDVSEVLGNNAVKKFLNAN